jgi:antitoxin ParD1/3/4
VTLRSFDAPVLDTNTRATLDGRAIPMAAQRRTATFAFPARITAGQTLLLQPAGDRIGREVGDGSPPTSLPHLTRNAGPPYTYPMETEAVTRVEVSLPESLHAFVKDQIASGRYGTISECIEALLRHELRRQAEESLESMLLEGLESGPASEMSDADWDEMRRRYDERHPDPDEP